MPYLIDGNNLLYALEKVGVSVGRHGLTAMLTRLAARERVCLVFDGPPPRDGMSDELNLPNAMDVLYAAPLSADQVIIEHIARDSAPHRLTVVSTDKEIRKAAGHRRCRICLSEDFVTVLQQSTQPPVRRKPGEPRQKEQGLTEDETQAWMKEFGVESGEGDDDERRMMRDDDQP